MLRRCSCSLQSPNTPNSKGSHKDHQSKALVLQLLVFTSYNEKLPIETHMPTLQQASFFLMFFSTSSQATSSRIKTPPPRSSEVNTRSQPSQTVHCANLVSTSNFGPKPSEGERPAAQQLSTPYHERSHTLQKHLITPDIVNVNVNNKDLLICTEVTPSNPDQPLQKTTTTALLDSGATTTFITK